MKENMARKMDEVKREVSEVKREVKSEVKSEINMIERKIDEVKSEVKSEVKKIMSALEALRQPGDEQVPHAVDVQVLCVCVPFAYLPIYLFTYVPISMLPI